MFCSKECADKYEEYRPKHKDVYEWQYYKQHEDGTFTLSNNYTEELDNKEYTKFEPSKRKRHDYDDWWNMLILYSIPILIMVMIWGTSTCK